MIVFNLAYQGLYIISDDLSLIVLKNKSKVQYLQIDDGDQQLNSVCSKGSEDIRWSSE